MQRTDLIFWHLPANATVPQSIDGVVIDDEGTQRGLYSGETLEQLAARYTNPQVCHIDEYQASQAMTAMHTPGPWASEKPKWLDPTKTRHIYDKDGRLIARIDFANAVQSENEAIANAALIAAAPELLSALQGIMKWWMETPSFQDGEDDMPADLFDDARFAITKSTGGAA